MPRTELLSQLNGLADHWEKVARLARYHASHTDRMDSSCEFKRKRQSVLERASACSAIAETYECHALALRNLLEHGNR